MRVRAIPCLIMEAQTSMLSAMRSGFMMKTCIVALLAFVTSCASQDGVNSQFDANPVHAPLINQVGATRDAAIDHTAAVGAEIADVALEPIRFFFKISEPGYNFEDSVQVAARPATPEERLSYRRNQMGLPESADSRIAARRSLIRARQVPQASQK